MPYNYITNRTSPNQQARTGKIASITIHHWGADGQTFDGVVNYLCRPSSKASAHYVVEAGRVACIVDPDRAAWHAGTKEGNATSIGIECRPEATDGDYATVAELIAALRKTYGPLPLRPHNSWKATACPGRWDLARLDTLAAGTPAPAPAPTPPAPAPAPTPVKLGSRTIQLGSNGTDVREWQLFLNRYYNLNFTGDGDFGPLTDKWTRTFQRRSGLVVDGKVGPKTLTKAGY